MFRLSRFIYIRYLDEQCFRFNFRKESNDAERFDIVLSQVANKRLTYAELTGKDGKNKPSFKYPRQKRGKRRKLSGLPFFLCSPFRV